MSGVTFERLPPERRIATPSAASAGSCCCCCCCCLHTVGSLLGAVTAKAPTPSDAAVPTAVVGDHAEPSYSVAKEYWVTVLILTTVALPLYAVSQGGDDPAEWAFAAAIFLPGIQLLASVIAAVRNAGSARPGQKERLRHLGSITGRAFIGGLLGILAMVVMFQFM